MALAAVLPAGALGGQGAPALDLASGSVGRVSLGAVSGSVTCSMEDYKLLADSSAETWLGSRSCLKLLSWWRALRLRFQRPWSDL